MMMKLMMGAFHLIEEKLPCLLDKFRFAFAENHLQGWLGKNALRMLYKKLWIKSNEKLNFFTNPWYYVTSLPGSLHNLATSSLYLRDFLYDVFCLQLARRARRNEK